MKYLITIMMLPMFLAACNSPSEVTGIPASGTESTLDLLEQNVIEKPGRGDVFLIQTETREQFIYAYVENGSEVTVNEEDDTLKINFQEPNDGGDTILQMFELQMGDGIESLGFYINETDISVKEVIYE